MSNLDSIIDKTVKGVTLVSLDTNESIQIDSEAASTTVLYGSPQAKAAAEILVSPVRKVQISCSLLVMPMAHLPGELWSPVRMSSQYEAIDKALNQYGPVRTCTQFVALPSAYFFNETCALLVCAAVPIVVI